MLSKIGIGQVCGFLYLFMLLASFMPIMLFELSLGSGCCSKVGRSVRDLVEV